MAKNRPIETQHKALLFAASVIVKGFLMATVSTYVFCGSIEPTVLFMQCGINSAFVGWSNAAVVIIGIVFGRYIVRLKSFNKIFPNLMKADFFVTAMYLGVAFTAPHLVAQKTMIWLFGTWVLGMLLAPFNNEQTILKKITEYGSLVALGVFFTLQFIPQFQALGASYTVGMMITSVLSVFGGGRQK